MSSSHFKPTAFKPTARFNPPTPSILEPSTLKNIRKNLPKNQKSFSEPSKKYLGQHPDQPEIPLFNPKKPPKNLAKDFVYPIYRFLTYYNLNRIYPLYYFIIKNELITLQKLPYDYRNPSQFILTYIDNIVKRCIEIYADFKIKNSLLPLPSTATAAIPTSSIQITPSPAKETEKSKSTPESDLKSLQAEAERLQKNSLPLTWEKAKNFFDQVETYLNNWLPKDSLAKAVIIEFKGLQKDSGFKLSPSYLNHCVRTCKFLTMHCSKKSK